VEGLAVTPIPQLRLGMEIRQRMIAFGHARV
jgi:hypothetical protein